MIEEGRRRRPRIPRDQRYCQICTPEIEDETHFLISCPRLKSERVKLNHEIIKKFPAFNNLSAANKFNFLMSQEDPELTKALAEFIHKGLNGSLIREAL